MKYKLAHSDSFLSKLKKILFLRSFQWYSSDLLPSLLPFYFSWEKLAGYQRLRDILLWRKEKNFCNFFDYKVRQPSYEIFHMTNGFDSSLTISTLLDLRVYRYALCDEFCIILGIWKLYESCQRVMLRLNMKMLFPVWNTPKKWFALRSATKQKINRNRKIHCLRS